ncbi:MAG: IclR family transcriptional regulator [Actinophytocola sp.]|uniref:IclR family transcriptional regulator n=1 Tax=Actinophytocola sp. TaxID=1872138 RepID=UPI003C7864A8
MKIDPHVAAVGNPEVRQSDRRIINAIGKTMRVLSALAGQVNPLGVSEIARTTQIPKSTTFRILATLVELRVVDHRDRHYCLGYRLGSLAHNTTLSRQRLHRTLLPHLLDLYEETHGVVELAVLTGTEITYLTRLHGHHHVRTPSQDALPSQAYRTAVGRVLLAFTTLDNPAEVTDERFVARTPAAIASTAALRTELVAIQELGLAFDRQEYAPGVLCVAAPVLDIGRIPVAAISVSGTASRMNLDQVAASVRRIASSASQTVRIHSGLIDIAAQPDRT